MDSTKYICQFAANGWADHICEQCGFTENVDIHIDLDWTYCPGCGRKIINHYSGKRKETVKKYIIHAKDVGTLERINRIFGDEDYISFGQIEFEPFEAIYKNEKHEYSYEMMADITARVHYELEKEYGIHVISRVSGYNLHLFID